MRRRYQYVLYTAFSYITSFLLSSLGSLPYLPILEQVRRQLMSWQIGNNYVIGGHGHYYGTLGNNGSCTITVTWCHREHRIMPVSLRGLAIKFRNSTKLLSQNQEYCHKGQLFILAHTLKKKKAFINVFTHTYIYTLLPLLFPVKIR